MPEFVKVFIAVITVYDPSSGIVDGQSMAVFNSYSDCEMVLNSVARRLAEGSVFAVSGECVEAPYFESVE